MDRRRRADPPPTCHVGTGANRVRGRPGHEGGTLAKSELRREGGEGNKSSENRKHVQRGLEKASRTAGPRDRAARYLKKNTVRATILGSTPS